jgi:hypothetical protein
MLGVMLACPDACEIVFMLTYFFRSEVSFGVGIPFRGSGPFRPDWFATFNERYACSLFLFWRRCVLREAYANFSGVAIGSSFVSCDFFNISHCGDCLQHVNKVHGLTQEDQN